MFLSLSLSLSLFSRAGLGVLGPALARLKNLERLEAVGGWFYRRNKRRHRA